MFLILEESGEKRNVKLSARSEMVRREKLN